MVVSITSTCGGRRERIGRISGRDRTLADQLFRVGFTAEPDGHGMTRITGYVYNADGGAADQVRLRITELDASGVTLASYVQPMLDSLDVLRSLPRRRATVEMTSAELTTIRPPTENACDPIPDAGSNGSDRDRFDVTRPTFRASQFASFI